MKLALIQWLDSHCSAGWDSLEGFRDETVTCQSVGWLVHQGEISTVIAPHRSVGPEEVADQGNGLMTIPTSSIVGVEELQVSTTFSSSSPASGQGPGSAQTRPAS